MADLELIALVREGLCVTCVRLLYIDESIKEEGFAAENYTVNLTKMVALYRINVTVIRQEMRQCCVNN